MTDRSRELLALLSRQNHRADALYHQAAAFFGQSDSMNWLLYVLLDESRRYSQQDLCEEWMYTKQTINSTVRALEKKGYVTLETAPGEHRRKLLCLTEAGRAYALSTSGQVYEAERRAISRLGEDQMAKLIELNDALLSSLEEELNRMKTDAPSAETEE